MPKKTRKEKLIAEYRKKLKLLESQQSVPSSLPIERKAPLLQEVKPINIGNKFVPSDEEKQMKKFFLIDFKKSVFIIGSILALEISLYFVSMYSSLRLIK